MVAQMTQKIIMVGCKTELKLVRRAQLSVKGDEPFYVSQVLEWAGPMLLKMAIPTDKGHLVPLELQSEYLLCFYTPNGLYQCRAVVQDRSREGNIPSANLKIVSAVERYQRRQFYRMPCVMPLKYAILSQQQRKLYMEFKTSLTPERRSLVKDQILAEKITLLSGTVLDISGGGMRFNSSVQQQKDDCLLLYPGLPEEVKKKVPYLFARILSSASIKKQENLFDNRVSYIDILNTEQEALVYYIFQREREKRKQENEKK